MAADKLRKRSDAVPEFVTSLPSQQQVFVVPLTGQAPAPSTSAALLQPLLPYPGSSDVIRTHGVKTCVFD